MTQDTEGERTSGPHPGVWRWLEIAALAAYVLLAAAHVCVIPLGQAPDEAEHLAYVRSIAENGQLPALPGTALARDPERLESFQAQHPPLYYVLMAPAYLVVGGHEARFYLLGRILSLIMGLAAILLTRRATQIVMPDRAPAVALCTIFASTFATYLYVMATVNNEVLAVLVFAVGLYFGARAIVADKPLRPILALGAMIGLALLVKLTATALLAVLIVVALAVTARPGRARQWRRTVGLVAAGVGVAAAIGGWWLVRNVSVYGDPMPRAHYRPNYVNSSEAFGLPELTAAWSISMVEAAVRSVWSPDWLVRHHEPLATVLTAHIVGVPADYNSPVPTLIPLALLLLGIWGVVRLFRRRAGATADVWLLRAVGVAWLWLLAGLINQTLFVDRHMSLFVGRYLPVMLPSLGMIMGVGVSELVPERYRLPASVAVLVVAVGYAVRVLLVVAAEHAR